MLPDATIATFPMTDATVLFREIAAPGGRGFGVATLNMPAALNALSADMVRLLTPQLRAWAEDPAVAGIVLHAAGDKAFCAGGDLRQLHTSIRQHGADRNPYAERFFSEEYELDHLIHTFPKPVLAWGHGIVMGGGVGLMAGASHRVVTERTRLAMPEIGIGLFPDVGGSWFLPRMPGRTGLFLALTAAPLNAADAVHCRLADVFMPHDRKPQVFAAIASTPWAGEPASDGAALKELLALAAGDAAPPPSLVQRHADEIEALVSGDDLRAIATRLRALSHSADPWLQAAGAAFGTGSPTSAALAFELWQRGSSLSLADVFRLEYWAALGCCAHSDFAEGIRALLIDKDRRPRWSPATLEDVTPALISDHLRPRGDLPARLAGLV